MALMAIENLAEDVRLGMWKIEETPEEMVQSHASLQPVYENLEQYRSDVRKMEKLSIYALLFEMTGDESLRITYNPVSKPLVEGYRISISHTKGYVVLILSRQRNVAVDIEYMSDRINKIVKKFIRDDEHAPDTLSRLIHWSVKETIYKLFSAENLDYFEMKVSPFTLENQGFVGVEDLKTEKRQQAFYRVNDAYVLTYAYQ
jgi:phosphopantetheinyl transferase